MLVWMVFLVSVGVGVQCVQEPRVRVKQGEIEGSVMTSFAGTKFFAFRGIPYAKPPLGPRRFKIPEVADSWEGVLDGTKDGPMCSQNDFFTFIPMGQEDCLFLNVYTPQLPVGDEPSNLPVMVYFHGGGFFGGDGASMFVGPHRLLDRKVVLVAMNYRLSVLGFLSTEDEAASGNFGLWDQNFALRWVQDNIEAFGGNPGQVTIFGASAGGASVAYHLISPLSKGLFHRAIIQSGSALCHWAYQDQPLKAAQRLARDLNCSFDTTEQLVNCLRQKKPEDILKLEPSYYKVSIFPLTFVPSIERTEGPKFLEDRPLTLFRDQRINEVPVISGIAANEGIGLALGELPILKTLKGEEFKKRLEFVLSVMGGIDVKDVPKIIELYMKDINLNDVTDPAFESAFIDAVSGGSFDAGNQQTVLDLSKANIPVYMYIFEQQLKHSFVKMMFGDNVTGVSHAEDSSLIINVDPKRFNVSFNFSVPEELDGDEKIMSEKIKDMWINFATYGDPTPEGGADVGVKWSRVRPGEMDYLRLRLPLEMKLSSPSERLQLWNDKVAEYETKKRISDEL